MPSAGWFILNGLKNVFEAMGHEWIWFDRRQKSVFDIFTENDKIDLYLGMTYQLDRPTVKCIQNRPEMKVLLKGGNFGQVNKDVDTKIYPLVMSTKQEVDLVKSLGSNVVVYNYYHKNKIEYTVGGWKDCGINVLPLLSAADIYVYKKVDYDPTFESDCVMVGGCWDYKSRSFDKWIKPLCYPVGKLNIKLAGNGWCYPQRIGPVSVEYENKLHAAATVCLNIFEPHCSEIPQIGEVAERVFKIPASKAFTISERLHTLENDIFTNDEIVYADNPQDLEDKIVHFSRNPDERQPYIDRAYATIIAGHTYHDRVADIFNAFGYFDEANKALLIKDKINVDIH